jgi:hypothetical protein
MNILVPKSERIGFGSDLHTSSMQYKIIAHYFWKGLLYFWDPLKLGALDRLGAQGKLQIDYVANDIDIIQGSFIYHHVAGEM